MKPDTLAQAANPKNLSKYLATLPMPMHHHEGTGGRVETEREAAHKGHRIVIRTTYQVEVDGRVLDLPLGVDNDGHVHCHSLPNYQFGSAIDMVKQLIDNFPDDFVASRKRRPSVGRPASHHGPTHMSMRRGKSRRK